MKRMAASNILIVGANGLGCEIGECEFWSNDRYIEARLAKNVILAGVKSVTIYDPEPVEIRDLSTQVGDIVSRLLSY